jgi:hypothetical protein
MAEVAEMRLEAKSRNEVFKHDVLEVKGGGAGDLARHWTCSQHQCKV